MSVLLCDCDGNITSLLNLKRVKAALQKRGERVFIRRNLCGSGFAEAVEHLSGPSPLVVGACWGGLSKDDCRAVLRRAGFDPFACAIVPLLGEEHEGRALALLTAAVERLKLFPGASEGNLKPRVGAAGRSLSRREFFALPRVQHDLVPSIDQSRCTSVSRLCRLCAKRCRSEAIMVGGDGRARVEKEKCTACGACVASCPAGAIAYPSFSPAEIVKEIEVILAKSGEERAARERRAILFACEHSGLVRRDFICTGGSIPDGLYPVVVPCLGTLNAAYFLAAFAAGADGVALIPCGLETCRKSAALGTVKSEIALASTILCRLDNEGERIVMIDKGSLAQLQLRIREFRENLHAVPPLMIGPRLPSPLRSGNCSLPALLGGFAGSRFFLEGHPSIPLGDVRLNNESTCTFCGVCTKHCPTGALVIVQEEATKELRFTYGQCVGCGECADRCPEKNLRIRKVIDMERLSGSSPVILGRESPICCRECGTPFLNQAVLDKIKAVFFSDQAETVLRMCPDCRDKTVFSSLILSQNSMPAQPILSADEGQGRGREE